MAETKRRVRFLYRGSLPDGQVFDDCEGTPHDIVLGRGQVMKSLEEALSSMEVGDERTLSIAAEDAYGSYDEKALQSFPISSIPNGKDLPVGETIGWTSPRNNTPLPAKVVRVENQVATLDFNHPLAGKDLVYWIKLVGVD